MIETVVRSSTRNARIVGALIILGYLSYGIPQGTHVQPLLTAADPLAAIAESPGQLTTGALLMAINSVAVVGIGLGLYPTLKQHNDAVALGYFATRLFEGLVLLGGLAAFLFLVPLSQEYVQASGADIASFESLATLAIQGSDLAYNIAMIALAVGSLPFCYLLYRTALVPKPIAVMGLIGYPALLALMVVEIVGASAGPSIYALYVPGAIFEIGLAAWLLGKGFDSTATASADSSATVGQPAE